MPIPRRESAPRDPCKSKQQQRCMPRRLALTGPLLAASAAGHEQEPDFPPC
jgi:hypothetical protein